MKRFLPLLVLSAVLFSCNTQPMSKLYEFTALSNKGETVQFSDYAGK